MALPFFVRRKVAMRGLYEWDMVEAQGKVFADLFWLKYCRSSLNAYDALNVGENGL